MKLFIDQAMWFLGDLNNVVNEIDEIKKVSVLKTDSEKEIKTVYKQFDVIVEWLNKQSKKVWEKIEKLETMLIGIINESVKRTKKEQENLKEEQENLKEELKADITAFWPLLSEVKEMIWLVERDSKREYEELEWKVSMKLEKSDLDAINKKLKKKVIDDENISEKTAYSSKKTIEKIDSMINNLRLWGRGKVFILNEWSDLWQATAINFTGSAVDVTVVNGVHTVDVTWGWWGGAVDSVNWQTGVVVLTQDNVWDWTTYKQYSDTEKSKLAGIEAGADVTDATNVAAAWAFMKATDDTDDIIEGATNLFMDSTEQGKLANITVTQAVDLDQMETDIAALANGMVYKWNRDASVWTFPWAWVAQTWWFYTVSVWGTVDAVVFNVWDRLIATTDNASVTVYASNWTQLDATDAVTSVNGGIWNVSVTMQSAFDQWQTITVANTVNRTLTINQNDTTNNPTGLQVTNTGTGVGIRIDQTGAWTWLRIDNASTQRNIIINQNANYAAGRESILMYSNTALTTGNAMQYIYIDNASSTIPTFRLRNDGTWPLLYGDSWGTNIFNINANGSIELWHASDTTISRVSAWVVAIEWVNIVTESATQALTNKSVNGVTLVNWGTATKYLSEDWTYTTPAWWGWWWTYNPVLAQVFM